MAFKSTNDYIDVVNKLAAIENVPRDVIGFLNSYITKIYRSDEEGKYSKPMLWIGMYVAFASLICILLMVGDLWNGLRKRIPWFPCRYFNINSASLSVIYVAMKLPVDLTTSMPGDVDQVAKLGSMAFMCSMMAHLLPSLTYMDSKEQLFTNIIALVVLVITLVVNICIQIATGVVSYDEKVKINKIVKPDLNPKLLGTYGNLNKITATIYVTLLLMLLIIHICSSLVILKFKQIIERQYQVHARALKVRQSGRLTHEELKQHVTKYWIMGATRYPHFISVCSATTSAAGVICVLSTILHIFTVLKTSPKLKSKYCESDYQWSMSVILVTQFIGVVVGTIASLSRCFAATSFNRRIWNPINVFQIESYWIQKLSDWKESSIPIPFHSRKCIEKLEFIILSFLIQVQEEVVATCKMISVIPFFIMMCVLYCLRYLKRINVICRALGDGSGKNTHQLHIIGFSDYERYVLQFDEERCYFHEEQELHEKTLLKSLLKTNERLIQKAEKQQPKNLIKLLEKSSGFEGVEKFDNDQVPTISSNEYPDCWSLPVVTLTAIVVSLPSIEKDIAKEFLESVSEAFKYVTLVEESLNVTTSAVSIQKAAKKLWREVEIDQNWLGHKLKDSASKPEVSIRDILQWFSNKAKDIVHQVGSTESGHICANSMYRITETIMLSYQDNIDQVSQEELFTQLSSMISDIVAACLTNLPQLIALKCQDNVHAATRLLGETTEIIKLLQDREPPSLNQYEFPFIHKWREFLRHSASTC